MEIFAMVAFLAAAGSAMADAASTRGHYPHAVAASDALVQQRLLLTQELLGQQPMTASCDENDLKRDAMSLLTAHFDVEFGAVAPGDANHVGFQYLVRAVVCVCVCACRGVVHVLPSHAFCKCVLMFRKQPTRCLPRKRLRTTISIVLSGNSGTKL